MQTTVIISESNNGISVDINIDGTEEVPVTLELIFRKGGTLAGAEAVTNKPDTWMLKNVTATYTVGKDTIQFGPGKASHKWLQLRGALPPMDAPTVYITGFTPFKHTIQLS